MKRIVSDINARLARLRQRLGLPPKRWTVRLRVGGWITLPPALVRLLQLKSGDVMEWTVTPSGLEGRRMRSAPRRRSKRFKQALSDRLEPTLRVCRRPPGPERQERYESERPGCFGHSKARWDAK